LRRLLATILPANEFWRERLPSRYRPDSIHAFVQTCPLLTKAEMMRDREAHPRFCQTSGTTGRPLAWLDTPEDWEAMLRCWRTVFAKAGVERGRDRVFFAFGFGPFLGFWTAFESALSVGLMAIPGGGVSSNARLQTMADHKATVLCCTPTYAVRLGELRARQKRATSVRLIIVAGEPGGSVPATRARIEKLWPGARVFDHHGLTECGPVSYEDPEDSGQLRVIEESHFAEVIDPDTGTEILEGAEGELVLTTLDRTGCPLLRFRTGDRVRKARARDGGLALEGGILGRLDDMVVVRGVNVYPSAIEGVLRRFPEVVEYQVREDWADGMLELRLVIELAPTTDAKVIVPRIEAAFQDALALRLQVEIFPFGSLPRFEFKSRRWIKAPEMGEAVTPDAR
jgi:phenylacetate-CoA ligase